MSVYDELRPRLIQKLLSVSPESVHDRELIAEHGSHPQFVDLVCEILCYLKIDPDKLNA